MTCEMTGEEVSDATHALLAWMQSQDINHSDAVRVMTTALVAVIHDISIATGASAKAGGKIIAKIIVESLP